jgi:hypothetical protein
MALVSITLTYYSRDASPQGMKKDFAEGRAVISRLTLRGVGNDPSQRNALLLGLYMLTFRRRFRAGTYPSRLTVAATCLTGASVE